MANILLNITIPDEWALKVLDSFITITGQKMIIRFDVDGPPNEICEWPFVINGKQDGETNKEFGERVFRDLGKAVVNLVDLYEDNQRYKSEVSVVDPPHSDVPDNILE